MNMQKKAGVKLQSLHLHGLFASNGRDEAFARLTKQAGAAPYERTDECTCYRNG